VTAAVAVYANAENPELRVLSWVSPLSDNREIIRGFFPPGRADSVAKSRVYGGFLHMCRDLGATEQGINRGITGGITGN
jgi:hypothetical protein